jgi:spore coat protein H
MNFKYWKIYSLILIILLSFIGCNKDGLFNPSDALTEVPKLEFYVDHDSYLGMLANRTQNYFIPTNIFFEGKALHGSLRPSGAGSRYFPRWSFRVELNENELIENINTFNLSAQVHDPTMLHTTLVAELYRQAGFYVFDNFPVFVKINNEDQGLSQFIELVNEDFFESRAIPVYELYKGGFESKFSFEENYNPQFHYDKKIPDDDNYSNLYELIHAVDTSSTEKIISSLGRWIDLDNYIKYHALTTLINNPDAFQNNFFIMREEANSPFIFLPWDFDRCFERETNIGLYGKNAIIEKLFSNDSTFNLYKIELENMLNTIYTNENTSLILDANSEKIRKAYNIDAYLGDGVYDFDEEVQSLKDYISDRRQFFFDNLPTFTRPDDD